MHSTRVSDHRADFDLKAYLGVLHDTLDAVKVRQVIDWLAGIVQHSSDSLGNKGNYSFSQSSKLFYFKLDNDY